MIIDFIQNHLNKNNLGGVISVHEFPKSAAKPGKTTFRFTNKQNGEIIGVVDFNSDIRFIHDEINKMHKFLMTRVEVTNMKI